MIKIAFAPIYKYELPPGHRFPMEKYELLPWQLLHEGVVQREAFFEPGMLDETTLLLTHTKEYWHKLQSLSLSKREIRDIGFPVRQDLVHRGRFIAQGTIDCARHVLSHGGCALNIAGGTHHAYAHRGEGFCVFNDFAIAANELIAHKEVSQILIVDLDVHQGNGTAHIFSDESKVFTFSMHGEKNYPLRKEQSDLDIALPDQTQDEAYLAILKEQLPQLIDSIRPDIVLYLAGVDVLASDKLGRLALTMEGCRKRDEFVFRSCKRHNIPVAVSMGGGYSEALATIINAHANTYKMAVEVFG